MSANDIYNAFLFGGDKRYSRNPGADREVAIQRNLERNITELALNRFKWTGFPETVNTRFLEMALFYNGCAMAYIDTDYDKFLVVKATGAGSVNMVDDPVSFTVFGPGTPTRQKGDISPVMYRSKVIGAYMPMIHEDLDEKEKRKKGVPIWPNYLRFPDIDTVAIYSTRLATIDRTLEINSKNARKNKVLTSTPNTTLSVSNLNRQIDEGIEAIQVSGALDPSSAITVLDLGILPDSYEKLSILRARWWNECMTLLGIDSANQDKKERLVSAEVGANDSQTDSMRFVTLNARKQACEQINEVFGYDVDVEYNVEVEAQARALAAENAGSASDTNNEDGE